MGDGGGGQRQLALNFTQKAQSAPWSPSPFPSNPHLQHLQALGQGFGTPSHRLPSGLRRTPARDLCQGLASRARAPALPMGSFRSRFPLGWSLFQDCESCISADRHHTVGHVGIARDTGGASGKDTGLSGSNQFQSRVTRAAKSCWISEAILGLLELRTGRLLAAMIARQASKKKGLRATTIPTSSSLLQWEETLASG